MKRLFLSAFLICGGAAAATAEETPRIGQTEAVLKEVFGIQSETERTLDVADPVYFAEVIRTATDSSADLVFQDSTGIKVGPDAEVLLDEFVYDPDQGAGDVGVTVLKGVMRFVSGSMDKSSYLIKTPAGAVTVRGTTFTLLVEEDGRTTVAVEDGGVTFTTRSGESVDLGAGESSSASASSAPSPPAPPPSSLAVAVATMDALSAVSGAVSSPTALAKASTIGAQAAPAPQTTNTVGASCGG